MLFSSQRLPTVDVATRTTAFAAALNPFLVLGRPRGAEPKRVFVCEYKYVPKTNGWVLQKDTLYASRRREPALSLLRRCSVVAQGSALAMSFSFPG